MQPAATGKKRNKRPITYGKRQRRGPLPPTFSTLPPSHPQNMFNPPSHQIDYSQKPPAIPPRPAPRSQKEATMAVEVSEENVSMMTAMGICDAHTARRYLRAKQNNLEAASNAAMDGEDITQLEEGVTWNEGVWSSDRNGQSGNDGTGTNMVSLGAPTAPPSRASTPSRQHLAPTSAQEQDDDMARAIAESMQSSQTLPMDFQQQTGTVRRDSGAETGVKFGPATRSDHDPNRWALVTTEPSTSEVVPDVQDVNDRVNKASEPRFIKPLASVDGDYLPSLLTICHAIAGAREALLMRNHVRSDYGGEADWWKGHAIALPRIVHTDSGQPVDEDSEDFDALIAEVQRIMAFLDQSERSYGSAAALVQNRCLKSNGTSNTKSRTLLELFLGQWGLGASANSQRGDVPDIFRTTFARMGSESMVHDIETVSLVDLDTNATKDDKADLVGLLDTQVWGDGLSDNPPFSIESPAEVIVMRLRQTDNKQEHLNVDVAADFYIDKYLITNEQVFQPVRSKMAAGRQRMKKLAEAETKLTRWQHPKKNEMMDARDLLKHSYAVFAGQNKLDADDSGLPNGVSSHEQPPHYAEIARKLQKVMSSIDEKLERLAVEKEKTRKTVADISRNPLPEKEFQPEHRYTLCGVSTKPNTTYVLLPREEVDEDMEMLIDHENENENDEDEDEDDGTPDGMQWWRIEYRVNPTGTGATIDKSKVPGYDITRAVELEYRSALLVYANEKMTHIEGHDSTLPSALQAFVERDNALFRAEIEEATNSAAPPTYQFEEALHGMDMLRPSVERKGSDDSLAAHGGDDLDVHSARFGQYPRSPPDYEHDGFESNAAFGLPPAKQGHYQPPPPEEDDAPVHEIRLDETDEDEAISMEMVKGAQPLIPGIGRVSGDVKMQGAESQDAEVGDAVEDVEMK